MLEKYFEIFFTDFLLWITSKSKLQLFNMIYRTSKLSDIELPSAAGCSQLHSALIYVHILQLSMCEHGKRIQKKICILLKLKTLKSKILMTIDFAGLFVVIQ